jgi:hypothetical protein
MSERFPPRVKVKDRMDLLQERMERNVHLTDNASAVTDLFDTLSKYWSIMSEEDKDYVQAAQYAVEERKKWKL